MEPLVIKQYQQQKMEYHHLLHHQAKFERFSNCILIQLRTVSNTLKIKPSVFMAWLPNNTKFIYMYCAIDNVNSLKVT